MYKRSLYLFNKMLVSNFAKILLDKTRSIISLSHIHGILNFFCKILKTLTNIFVTTIENLPFRGIVIFIVHADESYYRRLV